MAASSLLIPTYCIYTEIFFEGAGRYAIVTFNENDEVFQYDLEDILEDIGINQDWKLQNQITIDQRKRQLE